MHNDDNSIHRVHPIPKPPDFNLAKTESQFYTNLGLYRNAVNQCFKIDPATNQILGSQVDTNTPEGFFLSRLSPSGDYLSKMEIKQGGHGTLFGVDRVTDGKLIDWDKLSTLSVEI